jgi:hypothetical protein
VSESVTCLNESTAGAAKAIVGKGWCHKLDEEPFLESDADEQVRYCHGAAASTDATRCG